MYSKPSGKTIKSGIIKIAAVKRTNATSARRRRITYHLCTDINLFEALTDAHGSAFGKVTI